MNSIIIVFLFGTSNRSDIAPVISFLLKMGSCYFKMFKIALYFIFILNHPHLHSHCLIPPLHKKTAEKYNCSIHQLTVLSEKYYFHILNKYVAHKFINEKLI